MITLAAHIEAAYGDNVSAFAKEHGRSRPLVYRWMRDGAVWMNGRVYDPVTAAPTAQEQADLAKLAAITESLNNES